MTDNILSVKDLNKQFPGFLLDNVSFALPEGYVMGFIGPNGAGKTTTIKSILGMVNPDSGAIELFGQPANNKALMRDIGVVMDLPFYADDWTARDVQSALRPFYKNWDTAAFGAYLVRFAIDTGKKVKDLSRGMKVKLMVAVALSHNARLLILDEPTSGLDPVARDELLDILREFMCESKRGILFSTHITSDLEKIADFVTYINGGKIIYTGERDALLECYRVVKGGPGELNAAQRQQLIGLREHPTGFEALVKAQDIPALPNSALIEPATLDDIVIYFNKGGAHIG